jgi:hypothetical protein
MHSLSLALSLSLSLSHTHTHTHTHTGKSTLASLTASRYSIYLLYWYKSTNTDRLARLEAGHHDGAIDRFRAAYALLYCCFTAALLVLYHCRLGITTVLSTDFVRHMLCFTAALLLLYLCFTTAGWASRRCYRRISCGICSEESSRKRRYAALIEP